MCFFFPFRITSASRRFVSIPSNVTVNSSSLLPPPPGHLSVPACVFLDSFQLLYVGFKGKQGFQFEACVPGSYVPGYLSPEGPALSSHRLWNSDNSRTTSEFFRNDLLQPRPGGYTLDGHAGVGSQTVPGYVGLSSGPIARGYSPLEDPALLRREAALGIKPSLTDIERPEPFRKSEGLLVDESNILFVDGLPRDCTRREVAHLFRPFIGFKEIRVIHKEPRQAGEKGHVICFVEFDDAKCALTALQALQDYKFDDKKPDAPVLKIQFAKFPFRLPPTDQRSDHRISQH